MLMSTSILRPGTALRLPENIFNLHQSLKVVRIGNLTKKNINEMPMQLIIYKFTANFYDHRVLKMFSLLLNGNYSDSKKNCLSTKVFCGFISVEEFFCAPLFHFFLFFYLARIQ